MKRYLSLLLTMLIAISLFAACGAEQSGETQPVQTTEATEAIDYSLYYGPWTYDVAAKAKEDGKLHYYFMSNEGVVIDPTETGSSKYKWGDCCLIEFPDGQTMMIDSGYYQFRQVIIGSLQQMGIKALDYLVITHPHSDHQGGAIGTAENTSDFLDIFEVKQVYYIAINNPESEADELVKNICAQKNIPAQSLEQGAVLKVGDVQLQVLWPAVGTSETELTGTDVVNNNSMVLRLSYGEHTSLFAGDLCDIGEMFCINANDASLFDVDLLKVPHHGHKTSSSHMLLEATSPELAVATGNVKIGDEIRDRYAHYEIPLMYNYINGYIHVAVGADGVMETETSRNEALNTETAVSG